MRKWFSGLFTKRGSYEPGALEKYLIGGAQDPSAKYTTKEAAMRVSAVFASVRLLATTVSYLPLPFYLKMDDGARTKDETSSLYRLFRFRPNRYQDRFQFMESAMVSLLMRGDFYAQRIYNGKNELVELFPLACDRMVPYFTENEEVRYKYLTKKNQGLIFRPEDVFHVKALGTDPLRGMSVLEQASATTGFAAAQIDHGRKFYTNAVRPSGVLRTPTMLNEAARNNLKTSWREYSRGDLGGVALLENGLEWTPLSFTMEQSQFVQTSEATVGDVARWFGIPPHLIGDLRRSTFSNIEHQSLEFMKYHLDPTWLDRWQTAVNTQLVDEENWGRHYCEFLTDKLLRTDTLGRYQTYQIGRQNGWLNADEIRAKENMNPLPDGQGEVYVTALNLGAAQVGNQSGQKQESDDEEDRAIVVAGGETKRKPDASVNLFLERPKARARIIEWEPPGPDGKRRTRITTADD